MAQIKRYILSQKVETALEYSEWMDILHEPHKSVIMKRAKEIKQKFPTLEIGIREIIETEIEIE